MTEPTQKSSKRVLFGLAAAGGALCVLGLAVWLARRPPAEPAPAVAGDAGEPIASSSGTSVYGAPAVSDPVVMQALRVVPVPSVIVEVLDAPAVYRALRGNAWLSEALDAPIGRGFLGSWAGFLGTRGEDVKAEFSGRVVDFVAEKVLSAPFRVVWFAGNKITGVPAVVLEEPSSSASAAFAVLDRVAGRGTLTVERCVEPGEDGDGDGAGKVRALEKLTIRRWLLADHAVYAGIAGERLVMSRRPAAVLQGLCAELPAATPRAGAALQIELLAETLGRGADLFPRLLGLDGAPALVFGVEGDRLVPRGLSGALAQSARLGAAQVDAQLLRLVPEAAPVVMVAQLELPAALDAAALERFFKGEPTQTLARQIGVVWYPRGDRGSPSELALIWSKRDEQEAVGALFSGLVPAGEPICNHLVFATSDELNQRLRQTCLGKAPSLLQAAPPVAGGFKEPLSLALGLNLGQLLKQLSHDAYLGEQAQQKGPPAEVLEMEKQLAELPYLGLRGLKQGDALAPGGFRS